MTDAQILLQRIAELEAQNELLEQQAAINRLLEQQSKQQQQ